MKLFIRVFIFILSTIFLFSCERGELLNSEADIIDVTLPAGMKVGEPIITNDKVRIPKMTVSQEDNEILEEQLKTLAPGFKLTPGATISDDGVARDFTYPQTYTVTSEDKKWTKSYEISFFEIFNKTTFTFDNYELSTGSKKYYYFFEINEKTGGYQYVWDSGNSGFAITAGNSPADSYPTSIVSTGKTGAGAKLITRSTGALGGMFGMPIAAGNLFLGVFELKNATSKPLEATLFGMPTVMSEPKEVTLWCKYKPGAEYKDKNGNTIDMLDRPEVYAVLYEPEKDEKGNPIRLNGTNIKTADNIISIAVMSEEQAQQARVNDLENDEYKFITIPFESRKAFDPKKQEQGIYHITLVFSSSAKGNLFEGAVGSTLLVDEVEFITE